MGFQLISPDLSFTSKLTIYFLAHLRTSVHYAVHEKTDRKSELRIRNENCRFVIRENKNLRKGMNSIHFWEQNSSILREDSWKKF